MKYWVQIHDADKGRKVLDLREVTGPKVLFDRPCGYVLIFSEGTTETTVVLMPGWVVEIGLRGG